MGSVGKVAFIVILVLGAFTGIVTYYSFTQVIPTPGSIDSVTRTNLSPVSAQSKENNNNNKQSAGSAVDESKFSNKISITILKGSSIQGNPNFDPNTAKVTSNALVIWTNKDSTLHTATSGKGPDDPDSGKIFDSDMLNTNQKYSIPASKIGVGEHPYYCKVHPYMTGKIAIG
jgi:plastocyanin